MTIKLNEHDKIAIAEEIKAIRKEDGRLNVWDMIDFYAFLENC